ncbi:MAG: putative septation protein SpoVG [Firmicutes bacterium ADurb.Bin354]|nr:MAG: putative septation protein SpoVG [Firmicutes bacterium ADurb.Bin354]SCY11788.1 stage V sporulation protein G [Lachnospiraceae bacterium XPB1003]
MNVTDVRIRKMDKDGKLKAVASITIDDCFVIHDIKIIEGDQGLFIAMPSRKAQDGTYKDIAHPINSQTRTDLQNLILERLKSLPEATEA